MLDEIGLVELDDRHVDRHRDRIVRAAAIPTGKVVAGLFERPSSQLEDQPRVLGRRDERHGRDIAHCRASPPHQRLETVEAPISDPVQRLIDETELATDERIVHRPLQSALFEQAAFH